MTVTMVTPVHRWIAIVALLAAIATVVERFVHGVPDILDSGLSWYSALGWMYLAGYTFLAVLWVSWLVRLLRGTTAQVAVTEPGELRVHQPGRTVQLTGVHARGISVGSFWKWHWVTAQGSALSINGTQRPNRTKVSLPVAGPQAEAEAVADWLRTSFTHTAGPR